VTEDLTDVNTFASGKRSQRRNKYSDTLNEDLRIKSCIHRSNFHELRAMPADRPARKDGQRRLAYGDQGTFLWGSRKYGCIVRIISITGEIELRSAGRKTREGSFGLRIFTVAARRLGAV
jgi:hypothetical protein